jgi:hypothetical protein
MKFKLKDLVLRYYYLPLFFLMLLNFSQCVSKEEEIAPSSESVSEILEKMEKIPMVEDPDPVIENPDYGELFVADQYVEIIGEFLDINADSELPSSVRDAMIIIEDEIKEVDPELKSLMGNLDMAFLQGILDPEKPVDPKLEQFLEKIMANDGFNFPLTKNPVNPEVQKSEEVEGVQEKKSDPRVTLGKEQWRTTDSDCSTEVYDEYEPGFRVCGLEWEQNITEIEGNFVRRMGEAEERRLQRNELIDQLYSQKFILMDQIMGQVVEAVNKIKQMEKFQAIKTQLGCLGLVYAYYIRTNLSTLYTSGLALNEWYYQKEVRLITDLRDQRLAEAEMHNEECFARVEELIEEEIERRCS